MEIDDQSKWDIQELHVAQELCFVNGQDFLHAFKLQQKTTLNQHIKTQRLVEHESFVFDSH